MIQSHAYKHGGRINPLTVTIALVLAGIWLAFQSGVETVSVIEVPTVATTTPAVIETIEQKIIRYFPKSFPTIIAIAHAESGMNMDAKGYNCYYNNDKTVVYTERVAGAHSTFCKVQHRVYAHSVDCFALQKNYKGQECPAGVTEDEHLHDVSELSKVQGLSAWSSYNNGSYKQFLK